ncbi:MAG TPA: SRPBCC family protein [bacterium]|nr:SRPBCC family protein [bacterium]
MFIPGVSPFSSMLHTESAIHMGTAEFGVHGGMDQFHMMDPMEMRHGVFAWNGESISGGSSLSKEGTPNAQTLAQTLFPGHRAPTDAAAIAQVARHSSFSEFLKSGSVLAWTQNVAGEKIPCVYGLCELPATPDQVFDTLLDVNGLQDWMPRVMMFKSEDPDAGDPLAMRRRFRTHRSLHLENILSRFQTSRPLFHGRFSVDYRQINGGALQMEWNLRGDQKASAEDTKKLGLKEMKMNNSSFTLLPSPERSDRSICAYHLNVQPADLPFLASVIILFVPGDNTNELDRLFQSLYNRTLSNKWTAKSDKDPLGLELYRSPAPTPVRFNVRKIY